MTIWRLLISTDIVPHITAFVYKILDRFGEWLRTGDAVIFSLDHSINHYVGIPNKTKGHYKFRCTMHIFRLRVSDNSMVIPDYSNVAIEKDEVL